MRTYKSRAYKDRLKGHKDRILSLFSPDGEEGHILVSGSADGIVRGWDLKARSVRFKVTITNPESNSEVSCMSFTHSFVYAGFKDGLVIKFNLQESKVETQYKGHSQLVNVVRCSETELFSVSQDCSFKRWDLEKGECAAHYEFSDPISDFAVSGKKAFLASWDTMIRVLDLESNEVISSITAGTQPLKCITLEDNAVYVGGCDSIARKWDLETNEQVEFKGHKSWVLGLKVLGDYLFTNSEDKTICVWDKNTGNCVDEFIGHQDGVTFLEFSNRMVYSGSYDHSIRSWDLEEMNRRIEEKSLMKQEEILSRKIEVYFATLNSKKKGKKKGKKGGKGKKGKKGKKK